MSSFTVTAVLKTVENLGVSYVKQTDQYTMKLDNESKNLNFPYRAETVSMFSTYMHHKTILKYSNAAFLEL